MYEIINADGVRKAVKVVHKASIRSSKNKTKVSYVARLSLAHARVADVELANN